MGFFDNQHQRKGNINILLVVSQRVMAEIIKQRLTEAFPEKSFTLFDYKGETEIHCREGGTLYLRLLAKAILDEETGKN